MHAYDEIWIVIGDDNPDPFTFDLSKITPLARVLPLFTQRVGNHEFGVRAAQLVQP